MEGLEFATPPISEFSASLGLRALSAPSLPKVWGWDISKFWRPKPLSCRARRKAIHPQPTPKPTPTAKRPDPSRLPKGYFPQNRAPWGVTASRLIRQREPLGTFMPLGVFLCFSPSVPLWLSRDVSHSPRPRPRSGMLSVCSQRLAADSIWPPWDCTRCHSLPRQPHICTQTESAAL